VRKTCNGKATTKLLRLPVKGRACCAKPEGLAAALRKSLSDAHGMERLFEVWEQKV
jgi:hypothetical protein